ncbi:hypothetical protein M3B46_00875 [Sphingobacterium daejeonense]|uniref:hypothetical protein n=1 Tax=Sphingobacterium daejeonense TaxID=371142 RepID=UPI0021A589A1|nr:hypothetical protein [Sphingobacterium daejeonense]MCT1529527.1 hypothetical protein [Sphingobacterium daejeonense]
MKRFLLYFLLFTSPLFTFAQYEHDDQHQSSSANGMDVAWDFIADLNNTEIPLDVILSQWVIVTEPSDELYDYLEVSLEEIRLNLTYKNFDQIEIKSYNELSRKEVRDIDPEGLNVNNMYFIYYQGRLVTSIYVEGDKIGSFTLVSKGDDMAHFVTY